jgi:hypothetical protein
MPIIPVQGLLSAHGVNQADGRVEMLDLDSGHVFDQAGNTIARMEVHDDYRTQMLANYAHDYDLELSARSLAQTNPTVASQLLSARTGGADAPLLLTDPIVSGISDVHIKSALPNYASGYTNFTPMADLISPPVPVTKDTNYFWEFQKEDAFQRAIGIQTAPGGGVAEIQPRLLGTSSYKVVPRALGAFVSTELEANADAPLKIRAAHVRRVVEAMKLEREIRVAALLRTSASWNSATTILSGQQWNGGANSDPVKDIHSVLDSSYGEVTGIGLAGKTYRGYTRNPAVRGYVAYKDKVDGIPTSSDLQAQLRLPPFFICEMRYIKSDGTLGFVWGEDVVLFRNPSEMPPTSQEDVATSYTFRWVTPPTPDGTQSGGFVVRQYYLQDRGPQGGTKIVCVNYDAEKMTSKYIGNLLINAYQ